MLMKFKKRMKGRLALASDCHFAHVSSALLPPYLTLLCLIL